MCGGVRRCDRWRERQTGGFSRRSRCQLRPHRGRCPYRLQQFLGRTGRRCLLQVCRRCRIRSLRTGRRRTLHLSSSQPHMRNPAANVDRQQRGSQQRGGQRNDAQTSPAATPGTLSMASLPPTDFSHQIRLYTINPSVRMTNSGPRVASGTIKN